MIEASGNIKRIVRKARFEGRKDAAPAVLIVVCPSILISICFVCSCANLVCAGCDCCDRDQRRSDEGRSGGRDHRARGFDRDHVGPAQVIVIVIVICGCDLDLDRHCVCHHRKSESERRPESDHENDRESACGEESGCDCDLDCDCGCDCDERTTNDEDRPKSQAAEMSWLLLSLVPQPLQAKRDFPRCACWSLRFRAS